MNVLHFPNGLKIIYEKSINKIPITVIQVYCKIGSIYEPNDLRGVSHMIEHMCFKGTKKHPTANSIFEVSIGSDFNAYTEKMITCYFMKCLDKNLHNCIQILSDIMFHSFFHTGDYENEKSVVKEENIKNADELDSIVNEEIEKLIFKNTPFQFPIDTLDYHKSNHSLPLKSVYEYYKKHYIPQNFIISIHSSIPFQSVVSILKNSFFFKEKNPPNYVFPSLSENSVQTVPSIKLVLKESITTYISIGFLTCPYSSNDKYFLEIFETILSGGMNSYLFTILRDKNGLTYSSDVDTNFFNTIGSFSIYTEVDQNKVIHNGKKKGVLPIIIDTIRHFVKNGITKKQLDHAKNIIHENIIRSLEDTGTKAEHNALEFILRGGTFIIPYDSLFDTVYKNATIDNVNSVIRKYFTYSNMSVCLVGSHLPSLEIVKNICDKLYLIKSH